MATYTVDTEADFNYYDEMVATQSHPDVSAKPVYADNLVINIGAAQTGTFDTDCLTGDALGVGSPFEYLLVQVSNWVSGTLRFDALSVRHVEVTGESGTAPTRGDTITFDGGTVTGEFIRFHTMAGVKYMKLRSVTGAISNAWSISGPSGYSATTGGIDHIGTYEFCFEQIAGGDWIGTGDPAIAKVVGRGQPFILRNSAGGEWQGNGGDSQTVEHYSEGHVPCIWVETGLGTNVWEIYANCDVANFNIWQNGPIARVFKKAQNDNTITFGTAANGNTVPAAGARVRVPNLFFGRLEVANLDWDNTPSGGFDGGPMAANVSFDFDWCNLGNNIGFMDRSFDEITGVSQASNCAIGGPKNLVNQAIDCDITLTNCGGNNQDVSDANGSSGTGMWQCQSQQGRGKIRMIDCHWLITNQQGNVFYWPTNQGCQWDVIATRTVFGVHAAVSNPGGARFELRGGLLQLEECTFYGRAPYMDDQNAVGSFLKNNYLYSHATTTPTNLTNHYSMFLLNRNDINIDGHRLDPATFSTNRQPIFMRTVDRCRLLNVGSGDWDNPDDWTNISFNYADECGALLYNLTNTVIAGWSIFADSINYGFLIFGAENTVVQNCRFQKSATEGYCGIALTYATNTVFKSVRATDGSYTSNAINGNGILGGWGGDKTRIPFSDFFISDTEGYFTLTLGQDVHADFSNAPSAVETAAGQIFIPQSAHGEYIDYTSYKFLGHNSLASCVITAFDQINNQTATAADMYTWQYDIDTGSGFSGTFKALDMSGAIETLLSTETIDPYLGFRFKLRMTRKNTAGTTNFLALTFTTQTSAIDQRDAVHPINIVPISVTCLDLNTGDPVVGATVVVTADSGGQLPSEVTPVSIVNSGTTATCTMPSAHNLTTGDQLIMENIDQIPYNGLFAVTVTGPTTFTYTMSSDPGGAAAGSNILVTSVLAAGTTDGTGVYSKSDFAFNADQPASGWVRKGTADPFYKQSDIAGTVTDDGLTLTQLLQAD